jgi:hypothetical protein
VGRDAAVDASCARHGQAETMNNTPATTMTRLIACIAALLLSVVSSTLYFFATRTLISDAVIVPPCSR